MRRGDEAPQEVERGKKKKKEDEEEQKRYMTRMRRRRRGTYLKALKKEGRKK